MRHKIYFCGIKIILEVIMKIKNKTSLGLAILIALNFLPGQVNASQENEELPKKEVVSEQNEESPILKSDEKNG